MSRRGLRRRATQTTTLQEHNLPIEIRWVPAHTGVQGNEDADRAAKEATAWRERGPAGLRAEKPSELYSGRSTLKTWTHKEAYKAWASGWMADKRGRTGYRYTPKPTKNGPTAARRTEQAPERTSCPVADREDRTQRLFLQPKSAGSHGCQLPMPGRTPDGIARTDAIP